MSIAETTNRVMKSFRSRVKRLLERAHVEFGCKEKAVQSVAKALGKSRTWVHRVVNEHRAPVAVGGVQLVLAIAHCMKPAKRRRGLPPLTIFKNEHRLEPVSVERNPA